MRHGAASTQTRGTRSPPPPRPCECHALLGWGGRGAFRFARERLYNRLFRIPGSNGHGYPRTYAARFDA